MNPENKPTAAPGAGVSRHPNSRKYGPLYPKAISSYRVEYFKRASFDPAADSLKALGTIGQRAGRSGHHGAHRQLKKFASSPVELRIKKRFSISWNDMEPKIIQILQRAVRKKQIVFGSANEAFIDLRRSFRLDRMWSGAYEANAPPISRFTLLKPAHENPIHSRPSDLQRQIERVTYTNEESGYTVARLKVYGQRDLVTIVGNLMAPTPGEIIKMRGEWANHPKYGEQFKIVHYKDWFLRRCSASRSISGLRPHQGHWARSWPKESPGRFGKKTLDIIQQEIQRLIRG
ncbi:MAG: hypothetical protein U5R49_27695 [Deltaproteobacteria bacterium]|nr:hypothetical protein [Deltaproteobacteria bacterium]